MRKPDHVTVYRAADGWRWRFVRSNGRTLADSGEAYQRRVDCHNALWRVMGVGRLRVDADWTVGDDGSHRLDLW